MGGKGKTALIHTESAFRRAPSSSGEEGCGGEPVRKEQEVQEWPGV